MINVQIGDVEGKLESVTTKEYLEPPRSILMFEGHRGPHAQRSNQEQTTGYKNQNLITTVKIGEESAA